MSELSGEVSFTITESKNGFITIRSREFFILYDDFIEVFNKSLKYTLRENNVKINVNYSILKNSNINK